MEHKITATDAVRDFSEILNQIVYRGDGFLIHRNGRPAARLLPFDDQPARHNLGQLKDLFAHLPRLGDEAESFADDIARAVANAPAPPKETSWG